MCDIILCIDHGHGRIPADPSITEYTRYNTPVNGQIIVLDNSFAASAVTPQEQGILVATGYLFGLGDSELFVFHPHVTRGAICRRSLLFPVVSRKVVWFDYHVTPLIEVMDKGLNFGTGSTLATIKKVGDGVRLFTNVGAFLKEGHVGSENLWNCAVIWARDDQIVIEGNTPNRNKHLGRDFFEKTFVATGPYLIR